MFIPTILDEIHLKVIRNIWLRRFTVSRQIFFDALYQIYKRMLTWERRHPAGKIAAI